MSFRQEVRQKVLAMKARAGSDLSSLIHTPPTMADNLDKEILGLAARHTAGAQFKAFVLRYTRDEHDPQQRKLMERVYSTRIHEEPPEVVFDFQIIARNSLRAFQRILDKVQESHHKNDSEGSKGARDDA